MKLFLYEMLMFISGIIYFIIISIPLTVIILIIAHLLFIFKKLKQWIAN
jgi:hypothetical protein